MSLVDLVAELDIAESYPKFIRTTFGELDLEAKVLLKTRLEFANPNVILITMKFDQYTSKMFNELMYKKFGIGKQIDFVRSAKDFSTITVKFKGPIQWTNG